MKKNFLAVIFLLSTTTSFSQLALEGFESTTGPTALPNWTLGTGNWSVFDNGVGTSNSWEINSTVATPSIVYAGSNAAFMNRENIGINQTSQDFLSTPLVTIPANGQLRFWTRSFTLGNQGTTYTIRVAPSTATVTNPAQYTTIQTWSEDQLTTVFNIYEEKVVNLVAYAGQQVYVSFVMSFTQPTAAIGGDRWLVDNVRIVSRCLEPVTPTVTAITSTSANLSWANPSGATSWEIEIVPAAGTPTGTGIVYSGTLPYLATGLSPNTSYKYYVRALCSATLTSNYVGPTNFTTGAAPPVCGGNFVDSGGTTGNYTDNADITTVICPTIAGEQVTVTFTSFNTESNWDGLYVFNGNTIAAPIIASANPAGNVPGGLAGSYWGTAIPGPFTGTSTNGCLTFRFRSDSSVNNPGWIANITCAPPPTCPKPITLTNTVLTNSTANFGWTNQSSAASFQVIALPCGSPGPTAATTGFITTTANPYLFTGLSGSTCYDLYVRAVCSATDLSLWAGPRTVTTLVTPPACGGFYYDNGGPGANYLNSTDQTVTICPTIAGQQVTVTFTSFNTEANWDGLYVYDGNSIASGVLIPSTNPAGNVPGGLAGSYWGTTIPGPFTGSTANGCLTFRFRSDGSVNNPGWVANVTCAPPPTCPRPTSLVVSAVTQNSATIAWTEVGTATAWQVLLLPPTAPAPTAATTGWVNASANPFLYSGLTSGTQYKVYVRSVCSATDISNWSNLGIIFNTIIANNECTTAITAPVNADTNCTQTVNGTVIGATASPQANGCGAGADDDVWFQFVATGPRHSISFNNIAGSTTNLFHVLYSGSCGALTQIYCSDPEQSSTTNLVAGQTYYIRVYTVTTVPNQTTTFQLCIGTLLPPITTNVTQYTKPQLVQDVLLNTTCASVTNVTSSTGTDFGSTNGIGYFAKNGSSFPFNDGVVLTTGNALSAPGPNTTILSDGTNAWTGDAQLDAIILAATATPLASRNASKLEFDFVPLTNSISFNYIFASEEYGTFQCTFSDAFAFLLTNITTGVTTNLAVLPGTTTPVSVVTVRDNLYNTGCTSVNPASFGAFYGVGGQNPLGAPINYNGRTVPLTATATVTPGQQYHIKMVIADNSDTLFDSAVFLEGGSFNIGNITLGNNLLISNGTALCSPSSYNIVSGLSPTLYTFAWKKDGVIIPGQTNPTLTVSQTGNYTVVATYIGTTCSGQKTITVEFYDPIAGSTPNNLVACNNLGFASFNLSTNNAVILGSLAPAAYTISYHASLANATAGTNALPTTYTNTIANLQPIFVRLKNNSTGCFTTSTFNLIVQDLTPQFTLTASQSICAGTSTTLVTAASNYNPANVSYSWTLNGTTIANALSSSLVVNQAGTYVVTINNQGCTGSRTSTLTLNQPVVPTFTQIAPICQNTTAPQLPTLSTNVPPISGTWNSTISTATPGPTTYTFTPGAGQCATTASMIVSINPSVIPNTSFSYASAVCANDNAISGPATPPGTAGGTYSYSTTSNGTLALNPTTGAINLVNSTSGNYVISYSVLANANCQVAQTSTFNFQIKAKIEPTVSGSCVGPNYVLSATPLNNSYPLSAATSYAWTDSSGATVGTNSNLLTVLSPGVYAVKVTSNGCFGIFSFSVDPFGCVIPLGISPDGDGLNDYWDLSGFKIKQLFIYNRYGMKVYSKTEYRKEWNGQQDNGNELPDGTYFYVIERTGFDTVSGWVYINRKL